MYDLGVITHESHGPSTEKAAAAGMENQCCTNSEEK